MAALRTEFEGNTGILRGEVWVPPHRAARGLVLWNHGSRGRGRGLNAPRGHGRTALDVWLELGLAVFASSRRGYDDSAGQDINHILGHEEFGSTGYYECLAQRVYSELADVLAAVGYARMQDWGKGCPIICSGYSLGAILTILALRESDELAAGVAFALGAITWDSSARMRDQIATGAASVDKPVMLIQAANDYSTAPARHIGPILQKNNSLSRSLLMGAYGDTPDDGHVVSALGADDWYPDVREFLRDISIVS
ncbi:MAG TPA: hypothetical protein VGI74_09980 [Streptosporangiaceae bacterium]